MSKILKHCERILLLYDFVSDILKHKKKPCEITDCFLHGFFYIRWLVVANKRASMKDYSIIDFRKYNQQAIEL